MMHPSRHKQRRRITTLLCLFFLLTGRLATAQISYDGVDGRVNAVNTAVPFLRIAPDARSAAMGNAGIALSPDANAVFWNLSKLAFAGKQAEVAATYTPWLREMANDVFLANISAYKKLDDKQVVGMSLRYFDMGNILLTNFQGEDMGNTHPREYSVDGGYGRQLSEHFSLGIAFRFIHSKLATGVKQGGEGSYKAGNSVAGDVSLFYTKTQQYASGGQGVWNIGAAITNLGSRISYTEDKSDKYFIPSNLGIGAAYTCQPDDKNKITLTVDINKLLVPTPDSADNDGDNIPDYRQKGVVGSIFGSFGDAPGGLKEEFHELMYSTGIEYWYNDLLAVRAGYYNEYKTKGNRKYLTVGTGLRYKKTGLDFSYLIPSGSGMQQNPLSNTFRLSLLLSL